MGKLFYLKVLLSILCMPLTAVQVTIVKAQTDDPCTKPLSIADPGNSHEVAHFRVVSSPNIIGFDSGDMLCFGAGSVNPDGNNGTTATATQGNTTVPLNFFPTEVNPDEFFSCVDYGPNLNNVWDLTFTNGPNQITVQTPSAQNALLLPFARNIQISGSGTMPTISWTGGSEADKVAIAIYDLENTVLDTGVADRIFIRTVPNGSTSFQIPDGELELNHKYSVSVNFDKVRTGGTNPCGGSQAGALLTRTLQFSAFTTTSNPPGNAYLPTIDEAGIYHFDFDITGQGVFYVDPPVVIGYDYAIGVGNPAFASVILPEVGDNLFDLYLYGSTTDQWVFETQLSANTTYTFQSNGVQKFRILGIEESAGLEPDNGTAFITGLSFTSTGQFTGTMKPITTHIHSDNFD